MSNTENASGTHVPCIDLLADLRIDEVTTDEQTIERLVRQREALRRLVNYLEADPDLYDGDDDGALGRVMCYAKLALKDAQQPDMRHCQNAAPELLEALQEIIAAADGEGWSQLDAGFTKARAAVAKALGND